MGSRDDRWQIKTKVMKLELACLRKLIEIVKTKQ